MRLVRILVEDALGTMWNHSRDELASAYPNNPMGGFNSTVRDAVAGMTNSVNGFYRDHWWYDPNFGNEYIRTDGTYL